MDVFLELDPRHTLPAGSLLARAYADQTVRVDYRGNTSPCGRCGRPTEAHAWRVYDLGDPDCAADGGVSDCGILEGQQ